MKYLSDKENIKLTLMIIVSLCIGFLLAKWNVFVGFLISIVFSLILLFKYFRLRERRVESLSEYLTNLHEGEYSYDIESYEEGELAKLQSQLNKTTVLIQTMNMELKNQKDLLQKSLEDIAHQLKTPISSLLLLNEMQEEDELVLKSKDQLLRMNYLTNSLLKLVKLDADLEEFEYEEIVLDNLLEEVKSLVQPNIGDLSLNISSSPAIIFADKRKTVESLLNVITNKIRYAQNNIDITVKEDSLFISILISGDGACISQNERERIFERFYSGEEKGSQSIGIGLSIAREYMEKQSAKLFVKDKNTFVFQFNKF